MPGLNEEVERVQKPLLPPHFRTNFIAEKKAVRLELSRRNSLQKAPVSTVRPNRDLTPSGSWPSPTAVSALTAPYNSDLSDVEIVEPTPVASSSSLGSLYKHQGRLVPTVEGK